VLLDIVSVLGGIGLAVVGFLVVILVCVVILRLIAALLPSYEDRATSAGEPAPGEPGAAAPTPGEAPGEGETATLGDDPAPIA
jgi:hypothetical protein